MNSLIGTKSFYKKTILIALPIIVQNAITAFVAMLDNIMVGRLGTDPMSGVAITNQLMFVFNIFVFGGISGAGIFCAQYFGKGDNKGVHYTFRFKLYIALAICIMAFFVFLKFGDSLISLYLHEGGNAGNLEATKGFGLSYLKIMLIGLIPFAISQVYASTLRECGKIKLPMVAGIIAVCVNTVLNYILIFGKFGAPKLGSDGAAIATVISRVVEMIIIVIITHAKKKENSFAVGFYDSMRIPVPVAKQILIKGIPLLVNEMLWAMGMAIINQCYAYRGLSVVAAININSTIANIFNIVYLAMGNVVAIIIGQLLGAGKKEEAIRTDRQLLAFSVMVTSVIGIIMIFFSGIFPKIYNTENEVRELAKGFIIISSLILPAQAYCHSGYFTVRSGGKTKLVFLFDSGYMYLLVIPVAFLLSRFANISPVMLFMIIQSNEIFKCFIIYFVLKRGTWAQNIVENI